VSDFSGSFPDGCDIIYNMNNFRSYSAALFLCAAVIFMCFFRLGSFRLFDVDEAVFADATKEMVQSGNWITPTYDGENRYDKPIFFYWMMAVSYKIFGVNEFAARFPSALFGFLLCCAVYFFVKHFHDETRALYAAASLAVTMLFMVYSHAAVTDMALTFFITLSLFSFYISLRSEKFIYVFYVFSALAFLTKGLIGIVFPLAIASMYLLITGGLKNLGKLLNLKAIVLFILVSAPWYVTETVVNGREFIQQFFIKHHFARYTSVISGHKGPVFYYIPVLLAGLFPWIAFLPAGARRALKENEDTGLFAIIWFAVIFLFFSFSVTKLPNYIFPLVPAASVIIAAGMSFDNTRWRKYTNLCIAGISLLMAIALMISKKYLLKSGIHDVDWIYWSGAIMASIVPVSLRAAFAKKVSYVFLSCMMFLFLFTLSVKALPVANQHLQGSLYKYSLYAKDRLNAGERIIEYRINNPSIVFYSGHKVAHIGNRKELSSYVASGKGRIAIAKAGDIAALEDLNFNLLENDGIYAILERQ
jgi:4-amino-4-deoxy-L-arabinose transferase-like glycosyltransferase